MGSVSSPGIAGNKMVAVEAELCKHFLFQGRVQINLITAPYTGQKFDPTLPEGRLEFTEEGQQIPIVWIYCNDFLIQGASYKNCCDAVTVVMDTLLKLGLLAHPSKIKWPAQCQQFC
eukprot:15339243-Ditylum_brightwellii.AAC.1